jgi:hypothetical protein
MRRAQVSLPTGVWKVIDELKGTLGDADSEIIRNIIIAYLSDKGILLPSYKMEGTATRGDFDSKLKDAVIDTLINLMEGDDQNRGRQTMLGARRSRRRVKKSDGTFK